MGNILGPGFALARLAAAITMIWWALDWRSPFLASVRLWALMGFVFFPLGLAAFEIHRLRRQRAAYGVRALNVMSLMLSVLCLSSVLWLEARFQWIRYAVLHADAAQLEKLGRHVVVGYRNPADLEALIDRRAVAGVFLTARNVQGRDAAAIRRYVATLQDRRRQQGLGGLIIATDQEGGGVARLSPPLTRLPSLSTIVEPYAEPAGRRGAVEDYATAQARGLSDLGVNVNFAPVVD